MGSIIYKTESLQSDLIKVTAECGDEVIGSIFSEVGERSAETFAAQVNSPYRGGGGVASRLHDLLDEN